MLALVGPALTLDTSGDLEALTDAVQALVRRDSAIVIDCSSVETLSLPAIRMLERTSRDSIVTLTGASPMVCLLATVFGLRVEARTS